MYDPLVSVPRLLVAAVGGRPGSLWSYDSEDAHTDVDAANYFSNGGDLGLQEGDFMLVRKTDTGECTSHSVIDVEAPGAGYHGSPFAATISAAAIVDAP